MSVKFYVVKVGIAVCS